MRAALQIKFLIFTLLLCPITLLASIERAGFYLPDSVQTVTLHYKSVDNLIILPVVLNGTHKVNLILDTGCRNLVLFGKKFQRYFNLEANKQVIFSGLGAGKSVYGQLSLNNYVSINAVTGENIPVVIVPDQNLFSKFQEIHGVIGYDILTKFEVEIIPAKHLITFKPALTATLSKEYTEVSIRITDSRPIIDCHVIFSKTDTRLCDLMIDTGSTLGLLLKTTDLKGYKKTHASKIVGRGLNGIIEGYEVTTEKLLLKDFTITSLTTSVIHSPWHNYASIGMNVLKDYSFVINYCKAYAGIKKA